MEVLRKITALLRLYYVSERVLSSIIPAVYARAWKSKKNVTNTNFIPDFFLLYEKFGKNKNKYMIRENKESPKSGEQWPNSQNEDHIICKTEN
jgi:hypothetical protein